MLDISDKGTVTTCDGVTRRDFLQVGSLSAIGLSLPHWMAAKSAGAIDANDDRSAILIFNLGAPSQLDTFDPKPDARAEFRGPFSSIRTAAPDIRLSELLPHHAAHADKFSIVRSCHHDAVAVHDTGHQLMQTGRLATAAVSSPHMGCALEYLRGPRHGMRANVLLPETMGRTGGNLSHGQDAGFLDNTFNPALPMTGQSLGVRLEPKQRLRHLVEQQMNTFEASDAAQQMNASFAAAYQTVTSPKAREAYDLSKETDKVRDRYGRNRFGQCCLLARRLVEAGVRFVTINTFLSVFDEITWDIHGTRPFTTIEQMRDQVAPMYDQAYGALLEDLTERGLLDNTLVANLAEFGRSPKINSAGGRDHWPQCWSVYFAGGGLQGGRVVGKSDAEGAFPVERPTQPAEIVATIYRSLGLKTDHTLPGPTGDAVPLVDAGIQPIDELF